MDTRCYQPAKTSNMRSAASNPAPQRMQYVSIMQKYPWSSWTLHLVRFDSNIYWWRQCGITTYWNIRLLQALRQEGGAHQVEGRVIFASADVVQHCVMSVLLLHHLVLQMACLSHHPLWVM
jgi:hypothetical protein